MQSGASGTGMRSAVERYSATGFSDSSGLRAPFGRPRCDASTTFAPWSRSQRTVGSVAVMRVASATRPPSSGTFRSARTNTRFPATSRSVTTRTEPGLQPRLRPTSRDTSRMRFEKPHSLSYHDRTLMKFLSMTVVSAASKIDENGVPLKSFETSGRSQ